MVDLSALFAIGQGLADQAIATSGTTVRFEHPTGSTTDPDTLVTTQTRDLIGDAEAIVTHVNLSDTQVAPGVTVKAGDWRVVLHADSAPVEPDDVCTVLECRDARFVSQAGKVLGSTGSSAGAVRIVFVRPGVL